MKEQHPIQNDARRAQRRDQLPPNAACALCGEGAWEALTPVTAAWLEEHHVVNVANDAALTAAVCLNCHRKLTEDSRRVGASTAAPPTFLHRLIAMLRGLGAFLVRAGETLIDLAERLWALIRGLDARDPSWRAMPEAQ